MSPLPIKIDLSDLSEEIKMRGSLTAKFTILTTFLNTSKNHEIISEIDVTWLKEG